LKPVASLLAALCLPLALTAGEKEPNWLDRLHLSATGTVALVENYSRTSFAGARQEATTWELAVASTHARQLAPNLLLVATADATSLVVSDYTLNNHTRLGGRLALQRKFGLGPQATVLQLHTAASWKAARLDADRGWTTEGGIELAKRVLPNLRLAATTSWLEHTARRDTFDLSQHGYSIDARWDIDEHWTLSGSAGRLSGDIVANATWSAWGMMLGGMFGPVVYNYYTARPWATTHLFGPGWVSYNVEADVDLWSVSLGYAVSNRTSVEVRRSAAYIVNAIGISYPTDSWSLVFSHRF
jgi:hypothetical protein